MMSVCLITGDVVNPDHLILVMSARMLHCKVTVFPLINKCLGKTFIEVTQISYFSLNFWPLILALIGGSCLQQLLL